MLLSLLLQPLVGRGKLVGSKSYPFVEVDGESLLLAQKRLLQTYRRLVRGHIQNDPLRLRREVGPSTSGGDDADLATNPEGRACNRQVDLSDEYLCA